MSQLISREARRLRLDLLATSGGLLMGHTDAVVGAVATTQQAINRHYISLKKTFGAAMDGVTDDTAAWVAAATWSNANKRTVYVEPGVSIYTGGTFAQEFVSFQGSGMPMANAAITLLQGGTVVRGKMDFRGKFVSIVDMGVDCGSATNAVTKDVLVISNTAGERAHVQNVVALGRDPADVAHSILVEGFLYLTGGNTVSYNNHFGHAIKARRSNFGDITSIGSAGRCVIIKHDETYNGAGASSFGNILAVGAGATFGVSVLCRNAGAANLEMRDISIGNVVFSGVAIGCAVEAERVSTGAALVDGIAFGNLTGSATSDGFYTFASGGAAIYGVSHGDLNFSPSGVGAGAASYSGAYSVSAGRITASLSAASARLNNAIIIAGSVYHFMCDGISLPVDFGATNAGVEFNGTKAQVFGPCNFESYGASPFRRVGLRSPGTPAAGRFIAGEVVENDAPVINGQSMVLAGWRRLVTGSAHVMGTDWAREYVSHVTPAV